MKANMMWRKSFVCVLVVLVLTVFSITVGAGLVKAQKLEPAFGWISPRGMPVLDDARNADFAQLDAGMNYYYSDSPSVPAAVIKISKEYTMDGVQWKPITDAATLREVVAAIKKMDKTNGAQDLRSFAVKAPDTHPIGTWYSNRYIYGMRLNFSAQKQFSLLVPDYVNYHTYYAKKGGVNPLSQAAPAVPGIESGHAAAELR